MNAMPMHSAVLTLIVTLVSWTFSPSVSAANDSTRALQAQLLAQAIDARVAGLKQLSKNIASDIHIHDWVKRGFDKTEEALLLNKLGFFVEEYELTSASFADTSSHKYWNHEGFLRVLDPKIDTWYFAFLQEGNQNLVSVYHDKNKHRIDLYVNYRQLDGYGLSGVATSFDGVVKMMANSYLAQNGTLYLVDQQGTVQVHQDLELLEKQSLQTKFKLDLLALMKASNANSFSQYIGEQALTVDIVSLPNMGWYLVVETPN